MRTNPLKFSVAWRRMNVFRVCRWSLAALPVFFVFMACDKLLPTGGNGELVPVKIRAVSVSGYGEVSGMRSAGGEKRIIGEPIVQDLGDGMLAEITVEEEVLALRDAIPLGSDINPVKFRVIAVNSSDGKVYSYADYTVSSTIAKVDNSPELHVLSGGSYYFVCISYNSTTLPDPPALNAALGDVSVTAGNDLLWQKTEAKSITGEVNLEFKELKHQLTKVTLIIDGGSGTITSVSNLIKIASVASPATFNLATKALSGTMPGDVFFTGWGLSGTTLENSLRLLPTSSGSTLSLPAEAIIVGSLKSDAKSISLPALDVGKSYTVRLELAPESRVGYFAGTLTKNATTSVWQFTKVLYVRNRDVKNAAGSASIQWSTNASVVQGTSDTQGKANTYTLATNEYDNPAATICFQKNANYESISAASDANYIWYLPAQKQLMAIWVAHNIFGDYKFSLDYYWASTERSASASWYLFFLDGDMNFPNKSSFPCRARCVREI